MTEDFDYSDCLDGCVIEGFRGDDTKANIQTSQKMTMQQRNAISQKIKITCKTKNG